MKAVGESGAGGVATAAAGKKCKIEGGAAKRGGWTEAEEEAVRKACEATKGKGYEEAYEVYMRATSRSMNAFIAKARELGFMWARG